MTSEVNWNVLGLVIERASYGGELFARYERLFGALASQSHIYSALDALEARGLIEPVGREGEGRQLKLRYRATADGAMAYEDWLVERLHAECRRQVMLVRQIGIFARTPGTMLRVLERLEDHQCLQAAGPARGTSVAASSPAGIVDELAEERRRLGAGEMLSWLGRARERFEALPGR